MHLHGHDNAWKFGGFSSFLQKTESILLFVRRSFISTMRRVLQGYLFVAYFVLLYKIVPLHAFSTASRSKDTVSRKISVAASASVVDKEPSALHSVGGVQCLEVKTTLPDVGEITILEATADSQDILVNLALGDDDKDESSSTVLSSRPMSLSHADPYGAVLWPAATAVARTILLDRKKWLHGQTVCELGAGTGLVSLAAAAGGASRVVATDYEFIPLKLLEYAQDNLNPSLSVEGICRIETQLFDLCRSDMPLPNKIDIFLAADVMYEPSTGKALAYRVVEALKRGSRVLIGDSPGRAGRPAFLEQLKELGVKHAKFVDVPGWTVVGDRHDLICGKNSASVSKTPKQLMVSLMELDPQRDCLDSS
eukprot:scaffold3226_cov160-Amphora_coffeaeformis.AAC.2